MGISLKFAWSCLHVWTVHDWCILPSGLGEAWKTTVSISSPKLKSRTLVFLRKRCQFFHSSCLFSKLEAINSLECKFAKCGLESYIKTGKKYAFGYSLNFSPMSGGGLHFICENDISFAAKLCLDSLFPSSKEKFGWQSGQDFSSLWLSSWGKF